ncbi:MAG: alpha/beta fold hydrolase [Candidatus Eisenbacteria bacterium]|uniref:Alpha/beta fold hydrolase n=1 Tax=Eiseniibacteriota bacterium TaxID=2212470 RepID=A0A9D6LAB2_UNCEI|nr:alpha/beta fold hydrolase [Candidatus Eisenbacteria bacterium]
MERRVRAVPGTRHARRRRLRRGDAARARGVDARRGLRARARRRRRTQLRDARSDPGRAPHGTLHDGEAVSGPPPRGAATSRLQTLAIAGPAGALEALLHEHEGREPAIVALVCHPHPLYGGTMHNKVVHRVAATLHELGAAVLRFNFRGAGKSEGLHDEGAGELDDARAALAWLGARHPRARRWVAGFSFGAWIAARLAASERSVERLVMVAPPVQRSDFDLLREAAVPKLALQGTHDEVCPPAALEAAFATWAEPKALRRIEGGTHFFDRQLGDLADALRDALGGPAAGDASADR